MKVSFLSYPMRTFVCRCIGIIQFGLLVGWLVAPPVLANQWIGVLILLVSNLLYLPLMFAINLLEALVRKQLGEESAPPYSPGSLQED